MDINITPTDTATSAEGITTVDIMETTIDTVITGPGGTIRNTITHPDIQEDTAVEFN